MVFRLPCLKDEKRPKAFKLAVGFPGVTSAEFGGENNDELTVVGDNVDPVVVAEALRHGKRRSMPLKCLRTKGFGCVQLIKVEKVGEPKPPDSPKPQPPDSPKPQPPSPPLPLCPYGCPSYYECIELPSQPCYWWM